MSVLGWVDRDAEGAHESAQRLQVERVDRRIRGGVDLDDRTAQSVLAQGGHQDLAGRERAGFVEHVGERRVVDDDLKTASLDPGGDERLGEGKRAPVDLD